MIIDCKIISEIVSEGHLINLKIKIHMHKRTVILPYPAIHNIIVTY